jgi:hypothetical protein
LIESAGWLDIEEVGIRLRLFEQPSAPKLRYAVCPACADALSNSSDSSTLIGGGQEAEQGLDALSQRLD